MKEIIVEAGVAWHSLDEAKKIIDYAAQTKADWCKFQVYDKSLIEKSHNRWKKHLEDVRLTERNILTLDRYSRGRIKLFYTPMFLEAVDWLERVDTPRYKIRANDAYNMDLLFAIHKTNKPFYVSRINLKQCDPVKQVNAKTIFYDVQRPTKYSDVFKGYSNLLRADGYSCHCEKLLAVMQVMMMPGINYVEVHVTLDTKDKTLPDWRYSFPFADILELTRWRDILNNNTVNKSQRGKYELV